VSDASSERPRISRHQRKPFSGNDLSRSVTRVTRNRGPFPGGGGGGARTRLCRRSRGSPHFCRGGTATDNGAAPLHALLSARLGRRKESAVNQQPAGTVQTVRPARFSSRPSGALYNGISCCHDQLTAVLVGMRSGSSDKTAWLYLVEAKWACRKSCATNARLSSWVGSAHRNELSYTETSVVPLSRGAGRSIARNRR
jgi:hypothetical protein